MKKTQTKDTTGKIILSLFLLFLGEGLFSFNLYWPVLFSLVFISKKTYWYGFFFGVLVSIVTGTELGLMSLLIVAGLFIFGRVREKVRSNFLLIALAAVLFSFAGDALPELNWSLSEGLANFVLTWFLFRLDFFNDDLHLATNGR